MTKFIENVGKQVFMVAEEKRSATLLTFYNKPEEVISLFNSSIAGSISEMSLFHGTLTKAISIPEDINTNIDITIIVRQNKNNSAVLIPCVNLDYAQEVISALVGSSVSDDDKYSEEVIEDIIGLSQKNIDNIFIFYGYKVELHYSFDKTELDEEILEGSKEIYEQISSEQ